MLRRLFTTTAGPIAACIRQKLLQRFQPELLDIVCESHLHNVPAGSEKHFRVLVVAAEFDGLSLVQRHRLVNGTLADELRNGVHALRIDALSTTEFRVKGTPLHPSPKCLGGADPG